MGVADYLMPGTEIQITNGGSALADGDVFVMTGGGAGVATRAIAANAVGWISVSGIFTCAKATGAINQGAQVYFDNTAKNITTTSSGNTLVGRAATAALSGDATVQVRWSI